MEQLTAPGLIELDADEMAAIRGTGPENAPVIDIWTLIRDVIYPVLGLLR